MIATFHAVYARIRACSTGTGSAAAMRSMTPTTLNAAGPSPANACARCPAVVARLPKAATIVGRDALMLVRKDWKPELPLRPAPKAANLAVMLDRPDSVDPVSGLKALTTPMTPVATSLAAPRKARKAGAAL